MKSEDTKDQVNFSDEISLKELIINIKEWYSYLMSKWLLIVIFGLLGGILGYVYAYFKKPEYVAKTTFVLQESGSSTGALGGLASMVGIDVGGGEDGIFQGDNILELYKSRTMIEKALRNEIEYNGKKELLIDCYIDINNLREKWADKPELSTVQFNSNMPYTRLQDSIMGTVIKDINLNYLDVSKLDKKTSIIKAEVKAPDELFAKTFNNLIVKTVNDFYIQTRTKKSLQNVTILEQKVDSVRAVMNGAIYKSAEIADATPNLNPTRQTQRVAPMQRSQFSLESNRLILGELIKNLELSKIALSKETPLIQVVDEPVFPLEKQQLSKIKGLIIGGFLAGFLICLVLVVRRGIRMIIDN